MTTLKEAAQQALEALEQSETTVPYEGFGMARRVAERKHQAAIDALRAALAQQDERKPLTEKQISALLMQAAEQRLGALAFARAVERAHGIGEQE